MQYATVMIKKNDSGHEPPLSQARIVDGDFREAQDVALCHLVGACSEKMDSL